MVLQRVLGRFLSFETVSVRMVVFTALLSYFLQMASILHGDPLYLIAIYTLLPWLPIVAFEGLWKVENYGWVAVFGIVSILQIGHFAEHVIQVVQLDILNGTLACPPPIDDGFNARRAVEAGLRSVIDPTFFSAQNVVMPGPDGLSALTPDGLETIGPAACGVLGQLDIELVHLLWELFGWFGTLLLLTRFPRNVWLWIAVVFLSWHAFEHLSISYFFYLDQVAEFDGHRQLYATVADGNIVTAIPVGLMPDVLNFYAVAGKFGILAKNGLFDTFFGIPGLPDRPHLHMIYNLLITIPTVIGFVVQVRHLYNRYLARALPTLTEDELVELTPALEETHYKAGDVIVREGDIADRFFIVSHGNVEVVRETDAGTSVLGTLSKGQFFGEVGLLQEKGRRTATVRAVDHVRVLSISADTFAHMISRSSQTKHALLSVVESRLPQTGGARQVET